MRLFLALVPPRRIQESIARDLALHRKAHPGLKWVPTVNLHLTLRFLGEVSTDDVLDRLGGVDIGSMLPVVFSLTRYGTFGRPPRVLWISGEFSREAGLLAGELGRLPDGNGNTGDRPFRPHITVARAHGGEGVPVPPDPGKIEGEFSGLRLMSSELTPGGPVYRTVGKWEA
jgi:2'-5' RNA ligase